MLNDESLLRINDVLRRTGLSAPTLYRLIRANAFPRQVQIAERCSAWIESEVSAWIRERASRHSHKAAA